MRVKLVEPGHGPGARFGANVGNRMDGVFPDAYAAFSQPVMAAFAQVDTVTTERDVAEAVLRGRDALSPQVTLRDVLQDLPGASAIMTGAHT